MIYHKDIGFPPSFRRPVGTFPLKSSRHAMIRAKEKGFVIPEKINMRGVQVIEVELSDMRMSKMVVRGKYDEKRDIVLVIVPRRGAFFIKTAWLNSSDDLHSTLDTTKYARP